MELQKIDWGDQRKFMHAPLLNYSLLNMIIMQQLLQVQSILYNFVLYVLL